MNLPLNTKQSVFDVFETMKSFPLGAKYLFENFSFM